MPDGSCSFQMADGAPVVTAPTEIDVTTAARLRAMLPVLASLPPRGQAWGMTRYQAYQAHLAGHTIGETFRRAATFVMLTAANVGSLADLANAHASN